MSTLITSMPDELLAKVDAMARVLGTTRQAAIVMLLNYGLEALGCGLEALEPEIETQRGGGA
jgi:hypothetical protein